LHPRALDTTPRCSRFAARSEGACNARATRLTETRLQRQHKRFPDLPQRNPLRRFA
jgi:hypothetical protein